MWFWFELIFGLKNVLLRGGGGDLKMTLTGNNCEALLISRAKNWEAIGRVSSMTSIGELGLVDWVGTLEPLPFLIYNTYNWQLQAIASYAGPKDSA